MPAPLLEVDSLATRFGSTPVHREVSLAVGEGEAVTILGANGAGKTTLLRAVMGLVPAREGRIALAGRDVTRLRPDQRNKAGIAYVPEGRRVFATLSVEENLRVGAYARRLEAAAEAERLAEVYSIFPVLEERAGQEGGQLSGGQQQMLAIGRALMSRPRLLLLDEPSLGLAPKLVATVRDALAAIRARFAMAILVVEQNAGLAFSLCERGYLMGRGRIAAAGTTAELERGELVRDLYLGTAPSSAEGTR